MEGDPFLLIEGMTIAGVSRRRDEGLCLYPLGISARFQRLLSRRSSARALGRLLGPNALGAGHAFDIEARLGAGRLYLRRGDLAARKPRGQARPGARQAAAAGDIRPVRQADRHQQCAELCIGPVDLGTGRQGLRRIRGRPLARLAAVPARWQCPLRRAGRTRLRRDDPRSRRGLRRRHALRTADPRGPGRRPARRLFPGKPARHAARL